MQFVPDLVIFHGNCDDGFCSAWLAHILWPKAELIAANYYESPPDVTDKTVLVVDFSYKRPVMLEMIAKAKFIMVLDHHKTAKEELEGLFSIKCSVTFDMDKSGAGLLWEAFCDDLLAEPIFAKYTSDKPHWLVAAVQDRDLWKMALPYTQAITAALRSYPRDFGIWRALASLDESVLIAQGVPIQRYKNGLIKHHQKFAVKVEIGGVIGLGCCCTIPDIYSELAGELAKKADFGVVWVDDTDKQRIFSIRSRPEGVDVSAIAKQFGGGGHRPSAGFNIPLSDIPGPGFRFIREEVE